MHNLSFSNSLTSPTQVFLRTNLTHLALQSLTLTPKPTVIRMGGGPRTFPGGVSKWQWKRMQAKKAQQLLKARLCRERQIYEMRKRAELKAAVSELERPWEAVEKAPNLFSVSADEQVKVLADRFQRPGGFDLWTERDGPQLFHTMDDLPSARFFPKGVVHSVRPYKRVSGSDEMEDFECKDGGFGLGGVEDLVNGLKKKKKTEGKLEMENSKSSLNVENGRMRKKGNRRSLKSESFSGVDNGEVGLDRKQRGQSPTMRGGKVRNSRGNGSKPAEVFDMRLQQDGSYEIQANNGQP